MDAVIKTFPAVTEYLDKPRTDRPSEAEVLKAVETLLRWTGDDIRREGLRDTPKRVVKAFREMFDGYDKCPAEELGRTFEEVAGYDDIVLVKDISFHSHCEHHMVPIIGKAHVAYLPDGKVVGLSKIARVVDIFAHRLQTQEAMTAQIAGVIQEELGDAPDVVFAEFEKTPLASASLGQVHRARLKDGTPVAVKIQYPGIAEAMEADLRNAGTIVRLAKAIAPGLDAKAIAEEIRERMMEELDYEYEAQNQRIFSRAYREHPFIYVPEVVTRISRRRVLVTELVEGIGFDAIKELPHEERSRFGEIVFRGSFGSIYHLQHFNADPHPGNYILRDDGSVAFLDFGMTKKLDREQILLEQRAFDAASRDEPEAVRQALHDLGIVKRPSKLDAERLLDHMRAVGGWYLEDREIEITARRVMKIIESTNDPRSEYFDLMRRESIPADELMGRRMEIGVVAVLGQLRAKRNWHRILREWVYADAPATELGRQEWEYFEERGLRRTPGLADTP